MTQLDQIEALNAQIVALRRARIPVDLGLPASWNRTQQQLSAVDAELRHQLAAGQSSHDALDISLAGVPQQYRQLLWIGSRNGRLTETMETISRHLRRLSEFRTSLSTALVYPLVVCVLAYVFLMLLCTKMLPGLHNAYAGFLTDQAAAESLWLSGIIDRMRPVLMAAPPMGFALLLLLWWRSVRSGAHSTARAMGLFRWLPGVGRVVRDVQLAGMSDIAASLTESGVSVTEAMDHATLAVTGRQQTVKAPFLRWTIERAKEVPADVETALRLAADLYEERALQRAEWLRIVVPYSCVVLCAGGAVLGYALAFWRPFCQFMQDIAAFTAAS